MKSTLDGIDVVISGAPSNPSIAKTLADEVKSSATANKLVWVAGASNMLEADGVTLHHLSFGAQGAMYYNAHAPCIEAIKESLASSSDKKFVIFCPGLMKPAGAKSTPEPEIFTRCKPGQVDFVSYEDAARAMVQVAVSGEWDNELVEAITQRKSEL